METRWTQTVVLVALWGAIATAGFGTAVWKLWNYVMPELFGLRTIGYGHALALLALSWLLFGGWRWGGGGRGPGRRPELLSPAERERIRAEVQARSQPRDGGSAA